ncbi:MAG: hypothetical protein A2275_08330 [Bacteroidetes bacterium RIFOXYA12_FULL_35_11]|nr:MAG: hypothetical protein A2X01_11065 [Bacteroidetes bacterium GWF2_35_48]OFY75840.1 MAG: hypothetical protein A2275_08330 [Bacteroidetes bacterium RIFOXYA12_FULL_35_11]OFY99512.1 MAG: hypothetical protein A2491_05045 [Bacteroidetes bacterium RIFOXYC12_FULL_35_7]
MLIIWASLLFFLICPFHVKFLQPEAKNILLYLSIAYSGIAIPLLIYKSIKGFHSKGFLAIQVFTRFMKYTWIGLKSKKIITEFALFQISKEEKTNLLFLLVKFIFIPIMIKYSLANFFTIEKRYALMLTSFKPLLQMLSENYFLITVSFLFLTDTLFYTFGYIFESSFLKNKVKSVDTTLFGWFVALACYPPLNKITGMLFPLHNDYKISFGDETVTLIIRGLILLLLLIFTLSSFSLGFKCSNLTNRGIVKRGTYSIVRHPAYSAKIFIWWILLIPTLYNRPEGLVIIVFWTILYVLRAMTEEQHLSSDPDYIDYCKKVKYRFIPGVI